jgi:hypothetical protein
VHAGGGKGPKKQSSWRERKARLHCGVGERETCILQVILPFHSLSNNKNVFY